MFNRKILMILFLTLHLKIGLKSSNYCFIKQQACKGFYDEKQVYHIQCEKIKCHGQFSHDCGLNVCSRNNTDCMKYDKFKVSMKISIGRHPINSKTTNKQFEQKKLFDSFNKNINDCQNKIYKFNSNDFCINGKDCKTIHKYGLLKIKYSKKTECKCPSKQSFKCDKYCTIDSNACDYFKSNENKNHFENINDCGNHNHTFFRSKFFY